MKQQAHSRRYDALSSQASRIASRVMSWAACEYECKSAASRPLLVPEPWPLAAGAGTDWEIAVPNSAVTQRVSPECSSGAIDWTGPYSVTTSASASMSIGFRLELASTYAEGGTFGSGTTPNLLVPRRHAVMLTEPISPSIATIAGPIGSMNGTGRSSGLSVSRCGPS